MNELENLIDAAMERDTHEETSQKSKRERFTDCLCCSVKIPDDYVFCGHCSDAVTNIVLGFKVICRRFRQ